MILRIVCLELYRVANIMSNFSYFLVDTFILKGRQGRQGRHKDDKDSKDDTIDHG